MAPLRRTLGVAGALMLSASTLAACTSSTAEFCGQLVDDFQLTELVEAISSQDANGQQEALANLRELQDLAPPEIHDEFRNSVNVLSDLVRSVTDAAGPEGQTNPINLDDLNRELAESGRFTNKVAEFAESECGLTL